MSMHIFISTAEQLVRGSPHLLGEPYLHIYLYFPPLEWNKLSCFSNNAHIPGRRQPMLEDIKYIACGLRL